MSGGGGGGGSWGQPTISTVCFHIIASARPGPAPPLTLMEGSEAEEKGGGGGGGGRGGGGRQLVGSTVCVQTGSKKTRGRLH